MGLWYIVNELRKSGGAPPKKASVFTPMGKKKEGSGGQKEKMLEKGIGGTRGRES